MTEPDTYAAIGRAPYAELPPEDIALLGADPALCSRYCELMSAIILPPLRRICQIFSTKSHLNESLAPAQLDPLLPGIGRSWTSHLGSLSIMYQILRVYVAQFESLVGRWEQERYDMLQPDSPGLHLIMMFHTIEQMKQVSKKEVELIGMSSGSLAVSGSGTLDFIKGGAAPADVQTTET
jgi:hypothetical protein